MPISSISASARSASPPRTRANAVSSVAACATSGWPRAAGESRVCAAAARSSPGSCLPTVTIPTCTRTCSTVPPRVRSAATSASRMRARGLRCRSPIGCCRRAPGYADSCPTSCSCDRSSRTTAASCCSTCPTSHSSSSATRLPSPTRSVRCSSTTRSSSGVASRRAITIRRAAQPIPLSPARAARRGGLVVLSGRAAHETTLAGLETRPGARHLYGEVRCEAIERLQREALDAPRPQVVVRVDRSGLNDAHPLVKRLYAMIERIAPPDHRRGGAPCGRATRARRQGDDGPRRGRPARAERRAPICVRRTRAGRLRPRRNAGTERRRSRRPTGGTAPRRRAGAAGRTGGRRHGDALQAVARSALHPGEQRTVSLLFDPAQIPPGNTDRDRRRPRTVGSRSGARRCPSPARSVGRGSAAACARSSRPSPARSSPSSRRRAATTPSSSS